MKNILFLSLIAILAVSCQPQDILEAKSFKWRARNILNNHLMIVENPLGLPVRKGDTVCVANSSQDHTDFSIVNGSSLVQDTIQLDMYVSNGDTTYNIWQCHNVRLEEAILY